jgi:hypothetical protein
MADDATPEHLRPLPDEAVDAVCNRVAQEIDLAGFGAVERELVAFRETRTPHDGRRLTNALLHIAHREDLADVVTLLIAKSDRD